MKKCFVFLLSLALLLPMLPIASAETALPAVREYMGFADVSAWDWFYDGAQLCYELGLMQGTGDGKFSPEKNISFGEVLTVLVRYYDLEHGGDGVLPAAPDGYAAEREAGMLNDWQLAVLYYADEHELLPRMYEIYLPDELLWLTTRGRFFEMVWNILTPDLTPINDITMLPDAVVGGGISADGLPFEGTTLLKYYRAGIFTGADEYGTFYAHSWLTRGEVATVIARIADPARRVSLSLKPMVFGDYTLALVPGLDDKYIWSDIIYMQPGTDNEYNGTILKFSPMDENGRILDHALNGLVSRTGEVIVELGRYRSFEAFGEDGLIIVCSRNGGGYGVIDSSGREIVAPVYRRFGYYHNGLVCLKDENDYAVFDTAGNQISSLPLSVTEDGISEGMVIYQSENGLYGYMDYMGNVVIPAQYDEAYLFFEGLAAVESGGRVGFINTSGDVVIPFRYDTWSSEHEYTQDRAYANTQLAYRFSGGMAAVYIDYSSKKTTGSLIDHAGNPVTPFSYGFTYLDCKSGFFYCYDGPSGYAILDSTCQDLVAGLPDHVYAEKATNGLLIGQAIYTNRGLMTRDGEWLTTPTFYSIGPFVDGKALVRNKDGWFLLELN